MGALLGGVGVRGLLPLSVKLTLFANGYRQKKPPSLLSISVRLILRLTETASPPPVAKNQAIPLGLIFLPQEVVATPCERNENHVFRERERVGGRTPLRALSCRRELF